MGAFGIFGRIHGILLCVLLLWKRGVSRSALGSVGVADVGVVRACRLSIFSVAYSKILANLLNAYPFLPSASHGACFLSRIADVRLDAILTSLSIVVSRGTLTCVGYS